MSKTLLISLALATALFTAAAVYSVSSHSSTYLQKTKTPTTTTTGNNVQGSYTYFAFEREWPGTVCKLNKCTAANMGSFDGQNFNLHGLWPSGLADNVCSYPQDCASTHYSASNINAATKSYMNSYWVGLYSSTQSFLDHEWTKHGTCYTNDQNEFFTIATNLNKQYNPISALASAGIVPSDSVTYKVSQVSNALAAAFGAPVAMQCKFISGVQYFFAFDMYFSQDLSSVVEQPCKKGSSCVETKPLVFPTLSY